MVGSFPHGSLLLLLSSSLKTSSFFKLLDCNGIFSEKTFESLQYNFDNLICF